MGDEVPNIAEDVVEVFVTSTINSFVTQKRYPKSIVIQDLKVKLELITGASHKNMELHLMDKDRKILKTLDDDLATLGSYSIEDGMHIHVIDNLVKSGEFEDVSQVEKFELSDEQYAKRSESLRAFKEKNKLGQCSEEEILRLKAEKERKLKEEEELIANIKIGDRCEVCVKNQLSRRGVVMYTGKTDFSAGYWVGVKYDEPLGKNDGSVSGKRYFECPPKHGSFVKPQDVTIGNFPERNLDDDEI